MPPEAVAPALAAAQARGLARWYTDVASVKELPLARARELGCDLASFAGGHPLSGRERSGPAAARADLFLGRPWVICPLPETAPRGRVGGRRPGPGLRCPAGPHVCRRARPLGGAGLARAARGRRGHGRPAGARAARAPWTSRARGCATSPGSRPGTPACGRRSWRPTPRTPAEVLAALAADLAAPRPTLARIAQGDEEAVKDLAGLLERGGAGVARIPGKRGGPAPAYAVVQVVIGDRPGELARLFQAAGAAGINIEDVGIEHSPGLPVGVAELAVRPEAAGRLIEALAAGGWPVRR